MPEYSVRLLDSKGRTQYRTIQAVSESAMRESVKQQRMWIIGTAKELHKDKTSFDLKLPIETLQSVIEQLLLMIDGGLGIQAAVEKLGDQYPSGPVRFFLTQVAAKIKVSGDLREAFGQFPRMFSKEMAAMLKPAQDAAMIGPLMRRLSAQLEREASVRATVKKATVYPLIVMVLGVAVVGLASTILLPRLEMMLTELAVTAPATTRALFFFGYLVRRWSWLMMIGAVVAFYAFRWLMRRPLARLAVEKFVLAVPRINDAIAAISFAELFSNIGMLYGAGVPIERVLDKVQPTCRFLTYRKALADTLDAIKGGDTMSKGMERTGKFPVMCTAMIATGEVVGGLDVMLDKLAAHFARAAERAVALALTLLEPVMIVLVSLFVAWVLVSIFQPIFSVYNSVGLTKS